MDEELRAELERHFDRDQATRRAWSTRQGDPVDPVDPAVLAEFAGIDEDNTAWLRQVIGEYGWPGSSLVGTQGALHAWLLAQHADHDRAFQAECLKLLTAAVAAGEGSARNLAYLTDRVLCGRGEPQLHGTQFWRGPDGDDDLQPQPIADPDGLDERRAAAGLEPFAEYYARMLED